MHLSNCHVSDSFFVSSLTADDTDLISAKRREKKKRENSELSENRERDEKEVRRSLRLDSDVIMSDDHDS